MSLCCGGRFDCSFVIQLLERYEDDVPLVAVLLCCSVSVIYRVRRNWRRHGLLTSSSHPMQWALRQSKLDHPFVAEIIIEQMIIKPSTTLQEYVDLVEEHTHLRPTPVTVHRFFKRRGISWKTLYRLAIEAIDFEVDEFYQAVHTLVRDGRQLIFIDESNFYQLTNNRFTLFLFSLCLCLCL